MKQIVRAIALALLAGFITVLAAPAHADCESSSDLGSTHEECIFLSAGDIEDQKLESPMSVWSVQQICKTAGRDDHGLCFNPHECTTAEGVPGTRYTLFKDGVNQGVACLSAGEAGRVDDPPPVRILVIRAFESLEWKPSELTVQPKGGKSLVNLETNFFTTNTDYSNIPVKLIRANVVVSARPIAYRWHFGDGTTDTTSDPGSPYPDLDVSHVYDQKDKVVVSVDTQYGDASFTVNGGKPESIPSTIWVAGEEQDLAIVEALPQLVTR